MLRGNPLNSATLNYDGMMQLAQAGLAANNDPHRAEMIHLMLQARPLIEGRFAAQPLVEASIRRTIGRTYRDPTVHSFKFMSENGEVT